MNYLSEQNSRLFVKREQNLPSKKNVAFTVSKQSEITRYMKKMKNITHSWKKKSQ